MIVTHTRTLTKTVVWRIYCFFSGLVLLLMFGQDWRTATAYTVTINVFLTGCYYIYDRIWDNIKWGIK